MKIKIFNYLMGKEWFLELSKKYFIDVLSETIYNEFIEGCGLENCGITDKYEAIRHGWENSLDASVEAIKVK